jgi:hypothetical protein
LWTAKFPLCFFGAEFAGNLLERVRPDDAFLLVTIQTPGKGEPDVCAIGRNPGADFSSALRDIKALGAFFCNFATPELPPIWNTKTGSAHFLFVRDGIHFCSLHHQRPIPIGLRKRGGQLGRYYTALSFFRL